MKKPIRVVIVDDSALIRQILKAMFAEDPDIEVVGSAPDAKIARQMIKEFNPDVITLDIEMPGMDGLSFLEKIMTLRPMPVVMVSSLTQKGAAATLKALELGVVDVVGKPTGNVRQDFTPMSQEIIQKVKAAATAKVTALDLNAQKAGLLTSSEVQSNVDLIAIGASTGGVIAIRDIVPRLPLESPPIVVTQHMPEAFTAGFAARLNSIGEMNVVEAVDGMMLERGYSYIAPGSHHMRVVREGRNYFIRNCNKDGLISGHMPSVDALFESVAEHVGKSALGVILTGMGRDGSRGLLKMRMAGAATIGQDEDSCVVYGMPRIAQEVGAVERQYSLAKIPEAIMRGCWD